MNVLSSTAHVSWAMETVGEGFNLPIEEEDSISKAIALYTMWALEKSKRPSSINDNPQFFMQVKSKTGLNLKRNHFFYSYIYTENIRTFFIII